MVTKKRPDFGSFTKGTIKKPASMDDFLKDDTNAVESKLSKRPVSEQPEEISNSRASQKSPVISSTINPPDSIHPDKLPEEQGAEKVRFVDSLTFQTTVMFNLEIFENLELQWMKLKKKAPTGMKKKFSKSLIINVILAETLKEMEASDNTDHGIVTAIMQAIKE